LVVKIINLEATTGVQSSKNNVAADENFLPLYNKILELFSKLQHFPKNVFISYLSHVRYQINEN
jgi:hypothetical protein